MRVFKVALIVFFSILGIVGATVLGLYLTGKLETEVIPPADIFYADVVVDEEGNKSFTAHTSDYNVSDNFEMIIATTSTEYTQNKINLDFGTTVAKKYLKVNNETATPYCYSLDAQGNQIKYSLVEESEGEYITNGKIIVPKTITLGKAFSVLLCVAPDDGYEGAIYENTKLYNIGGTVALYAQSEAKSLSRINTTINIDVPVESIKVVPCTDNGSADTTLNTIVENDKTYYLVNLETYFGLKVEFTPKRSAYVYGKDGQTAVAQYKKVIFGLNNDEQNIILVNEDGVAVSGASDLGRLLSLISGDGEVFARVFKNAQASDENAALTLNEQFELLKSIGVQASANIRVTNITIDGFEITDNYQGTGNELVFDINNRLILTANNSTKYNSLGINILAEGYSQGAVQKEIENIYLSIQVYKNGAWVDATAGENKYFAFIGSQVYVMDLVDSDYYGFNFYQVKFNRNLPNNSYWEIAALANNEGADYSAIRIQVFYKSNEGIVENNSKYGPFDVECVVAPIVEPEVEWNENSDYKKSDELVADSKNEEIFFYENGTPKPIIINLTDLALITNLDENPANTLIKYFVCSKTDADLQNKINCKVYSGEIQGLSTDVRYVYELLSDEKLIISSMGSTSQFEFDILFAVVQNDYYGNAIKDGENYVIKALPNAENGTLITLPFRISKTVELDSNSLTISIEKSVSPYDDTNSFVLQRTTDCLKLSIKIKTTDVEIFKKQVEFGNISLAAFENNRVVDYLYYLSGGTKYALQYALSTYFDAAPVGTINGEYTIYEMLLSTNEIAFGDNEDEKIVNIALNYVVETPKEQISNTIKCNANINIYSGKINDLSVTYSYLDENDNRVVAPFTGNETVYIIKRIVGTEITTVYQLDIDGVRKDIEISTDGYLNVAYTHYGIDDVLNITSNNGLVLQISYVSVGDEIKYQLSALKSGEVDVTFKPQYTHSQSQPITVSFNVDANFDIIDNDTAYRQGVASTDKDGILSYDTNRGYTILGAPIKQEGDVYSVDEENANITYSFKDLVNLWIKVGESQVSVQDKLKFSVEISEDLSKFITLIKNESGEVTGFKPIAKLGKAASLVVYYYSPEIGYNSGVLNINLAPYYQSQGTISNHEGANVEQKEPDAKFVFAEAEIALNNFKVLGFNLETGVYDVEIGIGYAAKISANDIGLSTINGDTTNLFGILTITSTQSGTIYIPTSLNFAPVAKTERYVLTFAFADDAETNAYNFAVEYVFYVEPNIKVNNKVNVGGSDSEIEIKVEDGKTVYYLNSQETPFKNGYQLFWLPDATTGDNIVKFPFLRKYGTQDFDSSSFNITNLTIEDVEKLTFYELVINYSGIEFTFKYFAQPALSLPAGLSEITYNGQRFVALYAGQLITEIGSVDFGKLTKDNNIISYAELCELDGVRNFTITDYGDKVLYITKNEFGLFETYIIVYSGTKEAYGQYVVYKAMIFPEKWDYIKYTGSSETDVYNILNGSVYETITSGESISEFADAILKNQFELKIYDLTDAKYLENSNLLINVVVNSDKTVKIQTNAMGKEHKFKITFTVYYENSLGTKYAYTFDYYVAAAKSQEIEINYPYSQEKNSEILQDFEISHKVYYDEFENGQYLINLQSNKYNMFGKNYVSIKTSGEASAEYNKLQFEIVEVYVNNELVSNAIDYVTIGAENGEVVIKNTTSYPLNILIKITTKNGAEGYYKISVQNRAVNYVLVDTADSDKEFDKTTIEFSDLTLEDSVYYYDLSKLAIRMKAGTGLSPVEGLTLNFAVLKNGVLQTLDNIIYYDAGKLIVKSSPNQQEATLYAFSEEGIVAKIEIIIASPINIGQTNNNYDGGQNDIHGIYGDQTINLFDYLAITYNGTNVTGIANCNFVLKEAYSGVSISENQLTIAPYVGQSLPISINVELWDSDKLPGTSATDTCKLEIWFTIMPNIVVTEQTAGATANEEFSWTKINDLFNIKAGDGYTYGIIGITSNLVKEELDLYGKDGLNCYLLTTLNEDEKITTLTFAPKPVMAPRQVVVTIGIYKGSTQLATGTLTITIKPDTDVEIKYDNFGTNQTMNSYLIYYGDYAGKEINLMNYFKAYIKISGKKTSTVIELTGKHELISINNNLIKINSLSPSSDLIENGKLKENHTIVIEIYVDGLLRKTFNLTICKDPVFTARFDNGSDEINEELLASEVTGNPFWFVDGNVSITTNANRDGLKFIIPVIARSRLTGAETIVYIGGKGKDEAGLATLYFCKKDGFNLSVDETNPIENNGTVGKYALSTIFAGKGIDIATCFAGKGIDIATCEFYFGEFDSQVVSSSGLYITQPTKKITYFFNGYEMTFTQANEIFKVGEKTIKDVNLESATEKTFELKNIQGTKVGAYSYTIVKDYKLDDTKFADSPASGSTSSITKDTYENNEFDYGSKYVVSKTIELIAGNSYSLIELLREQLGLTAYRGGTYTAKETIYLTHGKFTTNNNFVGNLGSLISLQANTGNKDYTITPNGAQKGGDIVHLVVRFGATELAASNTYTDADTYIIRIRIMPSITITPISPSGEIILSYPTSGSADLSNAGLTLISGGRENPVTGTQFYNIPLSRLVTISGNYDITKMIVAVGGGSEYVVGAGYANRLGKLPDSETYGIQFKKTIFGGNLITLTISDRFGYSETITVSYLNEYQISPTILSAPSSIYEGEQFILAFYTGTGADGLKTYTCFGAQTGSKSETDLAGLSNVIIIDGFDKIAMKDGSVDTDYIKNLAKTLKASKGNVVTNYALGYNNNSIFGNSISILPSEFGLKLTLEVDNAALGSGAKETVVLDINTALNQKYKVVAKNPYSKYSTIYLGQDNSYNLSDLFEVWDLQNGAAVDINFDDNHSSTNGNGYLTSVGTSYTFSGASSFDNKISEMKPTTFNFNLTIEKNKISHTYIFSIALTPQYYSVKMEGDGVDSTYGIVVDGSAGGSYSDNDWTGSIKYYDYYGNVITYNNNNNVTFAKASGEGTLSGTTLSDLSANSPVTIQVNCGGVKIGKVLVTMRRYYALTGGGESIEIDKTKPLSFAVWANGIKALVVDSGTPSSEENIIGGTSLFTYSTVTEGYDIIYDNNQYKLKKLNGDFAAGDEIVVVVNYMSKPLGKIKITISSEDGSLKVTTGLN